MIDRESPRDAARGLDGLDGLADFLDYELPPERIAQEPCVERDRSGLLVARRARRGRPAGLAHHVFHDLPELLSHGDLLVLNDTRVLPARLIGRRARTGGRWEGLFLRLLPDGAWELVCQTRGRLTEGETLLVEPGPSLENQDRGWRMEDCTRGTSSSIFHPRSSILDPPLQLTLVGKSPEGVWRALPSEGRSPVELLERHGRVPLPPYIRKGEAADDDKTRYQTVFAREPGAVAAPTAGLHFTPRLFDLLARRHIGWTFVTLHVGLGTFQPIQTKKIAEHRLRPEWGELSAPAALALASCQARGGRVVAVGTTVVRLLETVAATGPFRPWSGETGLYIHPPYDFRAVDALVTNFHLPRSTLLLLVAAFAGIDLVRQAYKTAIEQGYRFYSYGDAMLIL